MSPILVGTKRSILVGILVATVYGIAMRAFIDHPIAGRAFLTVMTLDFLVLMPLVLGYLAVIPHPNPNVLYRILVPWIPTALSVAALAVFGMEGTICIVMAAPILLLHGARDSLVPPSEAIRLAAALEKAGIEHRLELVPGAGHMIGGRRAAWRDQQVRDWVYSHGRKK